MEGEGGKKIHNETQCLQADIVANISKVWLASGARLQAFRESLDLLGSGSGVPSCDLRQLLHWSQFVCRRQGTHSPHLFLFLLPPLPRPESQVSSPRPPAPRCPQLPWPRSSSGLPPSGSLPGEQSGAEGEPSTQEGLEFGATSRGVLFVLLRPRPASLRIPLCLYSLPFNRLAALCAQAGLLCGGRVSASSPARISSSAAWARWSPLGDSHMSGQEGARRGLVCAGWAARCWAGEGWIRPLTSTAGEGVEM
ncbi:hypothetical protein F7725_009764 [Dissostichus mawsoni]|uniref:Uncharacterized protein n=1 Tax=Dissostichus mawsoni TaxID=36200 RepID=A0A7J5XLL6_DISMA|nr:hypothetical protein F7725_009764 [Dissostichus mawsoni]